VDKPAAWNMKLVLLEAIRNTGNALFVDYNDVICCAWERVVAVCGNPTLRVSLDSRCRRERTFPGTPRGP